MAEAGAPRYFTIEEANEVLKIIRPLVDQILHIRQVILDRQPDIWPVIEKAAGNGGSKAANEVEKEFERLKALIDEINATGALFKDINIGLVDFLALREGREIYLCWQHGEDQVLFWHGIDAGFAGRQPI